MKNYVSTGEVLEYVAPVGGVVSGSAYLIGTILVVATHAALATAKFRGIAVGCVDLPKAKETWSEGLKLYWDDTAHEVTASVGGGNPVIGVAVRPIVSTVVTLASDALAADLAIVGMTLQVLDFATLNTGNATVTVTVNGVATVLTEDVEWDAAVSDEATATELSTAIDAVAGVSATVVGDMVTVAAATGIAATSPLVGRVRLDGATR